MTQRYFDEQIRIEQTSTFDNQNMKSKNITELETNVNYLRSMIYANTLFIILLIIAVSYLIGEINKTKILVSEYQKSGRNSYIQIPQQYETNIQEIKKSLNKLKDNQIVKTVDSLILQNDRQNQAIDKQLRIIKNKISNLETYFPPNDASKNLTTNLISPLIQPIIQNQKGERYIQRYFSLQTYLYNASDRIKRTKLINKRLNLFQTFSDSHQRTINKHSLLMSKYILKTNHLQDQFQKYQQAQQYTRLENLYKLSQFQFQLSMCIIGVGRNNADYFRIQANLNSIFIQNYSNYYAVIIDDVSEDGSQQIYQKYFKFYKIPQNKYIFIKNQQRKTALQNIDIAIQKYCGKREIFVLVDLDDQIAGKNTLKLFNTFYLRYGSGMVYSNFYSNSNYTALGLGFTKQYSELTMKKKSFRQQSLLFSHLRTARIDLYKKIKPQDLKHKDGSFYKTYYDLAIFFPIIQMCACGKVHRINEQTYFYNYVTSESDRKNTDVQRQLVHQKIVKTKPYQCQKIQPFVLQKTETKTQQSDANKRGN